MRFTHVTGLQLQTAAKTARVHLVNLRSDGRGFRATLGLDDPDPSGWSRWRGWWGGDPTDPAASCVCRHGTVYFLACALLAYPDARVTFGPEDGGADGTSVTYQGRDAFVAGYQAAGAAMVPGPEACQCAGPGKWDEQAAMKVEALRLRAIEASTRRGE